VRLRMLVLVVLLGVLPVLPAHSETDAAVIVSTGTTYYPGDADFTPAAGDTLVPVVVVPRGAEIMFTNLEVALGVAHSVTSDEYLPDGTALFDSGVLNFRQSAPVGVAALTEARVYGFHCRRHPDMRGYLQIVGL
jgi:hypothetical protein